MIGAGACGTLVAVHLLRATDASVVLIDKSGDFGPGIAYATDHPEHTLNVPAHLMGGLDEADVDGFVRWLAPRIGTDPASLRLDYPARGHYGQYLRALLAEAQRAFPRRTTQVAHEALRIERRAAGYRVHLAGAPACDVERVVLCIGNLPPPLVHPPDPNVIDNPWRALDAIPAHAHVVLVGTGLTMIDVALELGGTRRITAISRHGLIPAEDLQDAAYPDVFDPASARRGVRAVMRRLRAEVRVAAARGAHWQQVVDAFRMHNIAIWRALDDRNRRRFLRHLKTIWIVHRHRLPPRHMRRIEAIAPRILRARVLAVARDSRGLHLRVRPRAGNDLLRVDCDWVVNCTGPQGDYTRVDMPLVRALFADGLARPDGLRLGFEVGEDFRIAPGLYSVGAPTRATFWEITAVPHFRRHIEALVKMIATEES